MPIDFDALDITQLKSKKINAVDLGGRPGAFKVQGGHNLGSSCFLHAAPPF